MPSIKITYFDIRGRAEPLRLACVIGKLPFNDDRFPYGGWPDVKPTTPYGSVPVVELDGKTVTQSGALLRYFGKLSDLYPTDPIAALKVDEITDVISDFQTCIFRYMGPDKERLREERTKLMEVDFPRYVVALEKRLEAMESEGPYLVGGKLTIADLVMTCAVNQMKCGSLEFVPKDSMDGFKRMMESYDAVMALPEVKEWYKKYPIDNVTA